MLGLEMPLRPLTSRLEFNSQEVTDLAIDAIPNLTCELAIGINDPNIGLQRNGLIELQAGAGKRNVLQIGDAPPDPADVVFPLDVYHVRT